MRKEKKATQRVLHFFRVMCIVLAIGLGIGGISLFLMQQFHPLLQTETEKNLDEPKKYATIQGETVEPMEDLAANSENDENANLEEQQEADNVYRITTKTEDKVVLTFGGDILFDEGYAPMVNLRKRENGIFDCFSDEIMKEMQDADVFMLNNEFTYTTGGTPTANKNFTFRAKPESVNFLHDMGVDLVSIANNHTYDYGEVSLLDTLETLSGADIPYVGAGRNLEEAMQPVFYKAGDVKIGILAATQIERLPIPDTKGATEQSPGVFRCLDPQLLHQAIETTKQECDFLIVYVHWGTENTAELDWAQREQVTGIAEAGADLIIGAHSHCLQPLGYVSGVPVVYSTGNFWFNSKPLDTCLIKATVTKEGLESLQFLPARQENCYTSLLQGTEKERVLNFMREISSGVNLDSEGFVTWR